MSDDYQVDNIQSGASDTIPVQCSALRKNGYVMMKGRPCKIVEMSTSKTGKHGHAKVNLSGVDIFTGKKYDDMSPSTHNMNVPIVKKNEYTLIDISDDYLSLMNADGTIKDDLKVPENEVGKQMLEQFEQGKELLVTVVSAVGEEAATQFRETTK